MISQEYLTGIHTRKPELWVKTGNREQSAARTAHPTLIKIRSVRLRGPNKFADARLWCVIAAVTRVRRDVGVASRRFKYAPTVKQLADKQRGGGSCLCLINRGQQRQRTGRPRAYDGRIIIIPPKQRGWWHGTGRCGLSAGDGCHRGCGNSKSLLR